MKSVLGALVCASLIFSGCGKKKHKGGMKKHEKEFAAAGANEKYEEYLFDENVQPVDDLAFVEEGAKGEALASGEGAFEGEKEYDFSPIKFGFDSDRVLPGQNEVLSKDIELARKAVENGEKVVVEGYACQIGDAPYNLALTQRRASNMRKEFVGQGLPEDKVEAVGRGQENPLVWSDAAERDARIKELSPNRRVELTTVSVS